MTIREYAIRQNVIGLFVTAPFLLLAYLFFHKGWPGFGSRYVQYALAGLWILGAFIYLWAIECPNCHARLGFFAIKITRARPWEIRNPAQCPHCHMDVDAEIPEK